MNYTIRDTLSVREIGRELFIYNRADSMLHSFNSTGGFLWKLLQQGSAISLCAARLAEKFEVEPEEAEADVMEFLNLCEEKGLIEIHP